MTSFLFQFMVNLFGQVGILGPQRQPVIGHGHVSEIVSDETNDSRFNLKNGMLIYQDILVALSADRLSNI